MVNLGQISYLWVYTVLFVFSREESQNQYYQRRDDQVSLEYPLWYLFFCFCFFKAFLLLNLKLTMIHVYHVFNNLENEAFSFIYFETFVFNFSCRKVVFQQSSHTLRFLNTKYLLWSHDLVIIIFQEQDKMLFRRRFSLYLIILFSLINQNLLISHIHFYLAIHSLALNLYI